MTKAFKYGAIFMVILLVLLIGYAGHELHAYSLFASGFESNWNQYDSNDEKIPTTMPISLHKDSVVKHFNEMDNFNGMDRSFGSPSNLRHDKHDLKQRELKYIKKVTDKSKYDIHITKPRFFQQYGSAGYQSKIVFIRKGTQN